MVVGLTGGIGSGKTMVSSFFKELGVPVYISDIEAKKIMNTDVDIIKSIKNLFGEKAYKNDVLNRKFIATEVFTDKYKLSKLNAIVHPAVATDFKKWYSNQNFNFVIKESAILFETNGNKDCDVVILVTAPVEVRISRVIIRDKTTKEEVKARIKNQWDDALKIPKADYVIINMIKENTKKEVYELYQIFKARSLSC